jgi:hypothetical protein
MVIRIIHSNSFVLFVFRLPFISIILCRSPPYFASAAVYYTELFDEIYQINTGRVERGMMVYETGNIARSLRTGLDAEGKCTFFKQAFLSAGYSYVFAWDRNAQAELRPQPARTVKFKAGFDTAKAALPADGKAKK